MKKKENYVIVCVIEDEKKRNLKRTVWVREWLTKRSTDGACKKKIENQNFSFNNFLRMNDDIKIKTYLTYENKYCYKKKYLFKHYY